MKLCSESCIPCCDFCIFCIHEFYENIKCEPISCYLHQDYEHQEKARGCSYCKDFHCFNVKEK